MKNYVNVYGIEVAERSNESVKKKLVQVQISAGHNNIQNKSLLN